MGARRHRRRPRSTRVVAEIRDALGPVDILVNDAGVSLPVPIDADDYERSWDATFAVNLTGRSA